MRLICAAVLLASVQPVRAGEENPFKKAKVGDWAEYKMSGPNIEGKTKMTVVAKDAKEVTYEVTGEVAFMGKKLAVPVQKQKIDLAKPYDPTADPIVVANLRKADVKTEKIGEGKVKIKVGEKEFDTKWTRLKLTATANNITVVGDVKMWFSKDVPSSGLVRIEMLTSGMKVKLELTGSGGK
jgi:hypothetical protein